MGLALIVGSLVVGVVVLTGLVGHLIDTSAGAEKDPVMEKPAEAPLPEQDLKVTRSSR